MLHSCSFASRLAVHTTRRTYHSLRPFSSSSNFRKSDGSHVCDTTRDIQSIPGVAGVAEDVPKELRGLADVHKADQFMIQENKAKDDKSISQKPERKRRSSPVKDDGEKPKAKIRRPRKAKKPGEETIASHVGNVIQRKRRPSKPKSPRPMIPGDGNVVDVNQCLSFLYGPKSSLSAGDKRRVHVISESLCDDVLERLEPTLDRHMGCDIIDINPGACIWSSKIHNRLKPRTHILFEPNEKSFRPFLTPLIEAPGSTYKLVPKSGIVWGHLEDVLTETYLPHQVAREWDDPRLEERNDTLLVIANLGYYPKKVYRGFDSIATLVLYQFMSAMRTHSLFERYGRVRVLAWADDGERKCYLPQELHARRKTSMEAEIACDVREIASSTQYPLKQREHVLDIATAQQVKMRMENAGISTPSNRTSRLFEDIEKKESSDHVQTETLLSRRDISEMETLKAEYAAGDFTASEDEKSTSSSEPLPASLSQATKPVYSVKYTRMKRLEYRNNSFINAKNSTFSKLHTFDSIIAMQKEIHNRKASGASTAELDIEMADKRKEWEEYLDTLTHPQFSRLMMKIDNRAAHELDPQTLAWDRRETEPLRVHANEFFPPHEMCLLDFQPRKLWPILRQNSGRNYDVLEFMLTNMFSTPAQSVKSALTSLWPGAFEWLEAECPSLTNPHKGGSLDLSMIRVRSITLEMVEEMVEAWARWPYKPDTFSLIARMGSSAHTSSLVDDD